MAYPTCHGQDNSNRAKGGNDRTGIMGLHGCIKYLKPLHGQPEVLRTKFGREMYHLRQCIVGKGILVLCNAWKDLGVPKSLIGTSYSPGRGLLGTGNFFSGCLLHFLTTATYHVNYLPSDYFQTALRFGSGSCMLMWNSDATDRPELLCRVVNFIVDETYHLQHATRRMST